MNTPNLSQLVKIARRATHEYAELYLILLFIIIRYKENLSGGVTMDEVFYAQSGLSMFEGYMFGNPTHMHAPLVKYFIGVSQVVFGVSEISIRAPIAIFGLLTVVATYGVGRQVFDRGTGMIAAVLIALLPKYNYYATMAMLDVPLALFVLLAFSTAVFWRRNTKDVWPAAILGVLSVFSGATKVQGAVYVFGILAIVIWMLTVERRNQWKKIIIYYAVAATGAFALVYLPFAFSPAPTYYGGAEPPQFAKTFFLIPWIGSVAFAFAASLVHNLSHLDSGHRVIVAGKTYFHPPAWVFFFWVSKQGGIPYLVGIATSIGALLGRFGDRAIQICFGGLLFIPLLIHTGLSVKLSRYLVPLYPLVALAGGWGITQLGSIVLEYGSSREYVCNVSVRQIAIAAVTILLVISLLPPSFATTVTEESIQTDSGIDVGANAIVEHGQDEGTITAVVSNPLPYRWYLGEHRVGRFTKNVQNPKKFQQESAQITLVGTKYTEIERILKEQSPCIVVVSQSWLNKQDESHVVYRYIQESNQIKSHSRVRIYDACPNSSR